MKIQLKAKAVTWQGRTVYRAYYLDVHTWRRFGQYEAATPETLRAIIDNTEHSAEFVWK
jgi:phage-related protein